MDLQVNQRIEHELSAIEAREKITILYACESGSRAWGFASADSDYDVRYFYLRPPEWYLSIVAGKDTIEGPADGVLDFSGWDLRKTLDLIRRSNPQLMEWLQSPIVYRNQGTALSRLQALMPQYHSPRAGLYHYLRMAKADYRKHFRGEMVSTKKTLYVLRPLLACLWIERGYGPAPMAFSCLVDRLVDDPLLLQGIKELLARKRAGKELDLGEPIPAISAFVERHLPRLISDPSAQPISQSAMPLDRLFIELLIETYGDRIRPATEL